MKWTVKQRSMYDHPHDGDWFIQGYDGGDDLVYLHSDGNIRPLPLYEDSYTGYFKTKEEAERALALYASRKWNVIDYIVYFAEVERKAFQVRQDLVRKFGRELIGDRILEVLTEGPLALFKEGRVDRAKELAGFLKELIRDGEGTLNG